MRSGLTLIELLISVAIAAILIGVVVASLKTSFETYSFSQEQALLERAVESVLDGVTGSGFENYGIKDALEILDISPISIMFVPMWVADTDVKSSEVFVLDPPLRAGSALPIAEVSDERAGRGRKGSREWQTIPITFTPGDPADARHAGDSISLNQDITPGTRMRIIYQPDASGFPDDAMTIGWDAGKVIRKYRGLEQAIPRRGIPGVELSGFNLQYFDNTNTEVKADVTEISNVTAVKVSITATMKSPRKEPAGAPDKTAASKTGFVFINLRNTRTGGAGLLLRQGARIRISDSRKMRMFSLTNVTGAKEGGAIELLAIPANGASWKVIVNLARSDGASIITGYTIEYPEGSPIHSESLNLTGDLPLNFMNLGPSVSYGSNRAKYSPNDPNTINVSGDVELVVKRMDAKGAMLFIRP